MDRLVQRADDQLHSLGLVFDEDDEHDSVTSLDQRRNPPHLATGKLKSGKEAKLTSEVRDPQYWPHSHLSFSRGRGEVRYDDLTLEEFVAGYTQILLRPTLPAVEKQARLQHLVSIMYLAMQYEWSAILQYHEAVLLEIERGLARWGDSFTHLESRTLYGSVKSSSTRTSNTTPVLFCRDFQRGTCTHNRDHHGSVKGVQRWVRHICASCWNAHRKQERHRENSPACPQHVSETPATPQS